MAGRRAGAIAVAGVLCLVTGCGAVLDTPGATTTFAERPPTYVTQDGARAVLHVGEDDLRLPPFVSQVWPTAHGYLVAHRLGASFETTEVKSLVTTDGTQRLPGDPSDVRVSPDGRYAGWLDHDGPRRVGYRLTEAVVVDLSTGEELLRDHRDMGGWFDQDLYGNVWPTFLGFDDEAAYWETPEAGADGLTVRRLDLDSGEVTGVDEDAERVARGTIVEPGLGRQVVLGTDLRPDAGAPDGLLGQQQGRWCLSVSVTGRLPVADCTSGERATPDYPARHVRLAGWSEDPDAYYVLATDDELGLDVPPDEPDPSSGVLARCTLPRGTCTVVERVRRLGSLVLPGGQVL